MPLAQQVLIECKDQYTAFQRMQRLRQIFTKPKEGADIEAQVGHHFQIQVPKILGCFSDLCALKVRKSSGGMERTTLPCGTGQFV